ncbi:MAG: glycosyltransferase family 39 protein [Thermoflexales bacterium]|nr:glycosyltransferase family 39 protein [Thermoflexales bacterium]
MQKKLTSHTVWLGAILAAYCILGITYSAVTPIFEASDELWHYPVVWHIAAGRGLPVQTPPDRPGLWKQEASQPPLYYALAGLLTAWIDTGELGAPFLNGTLRPNPHAAIGVVSPDGNINMVTHDPAREGWPWQGAVLAVHLCRLLSVTLGAATVYLAYRLAREAFPTRPEIALGAAAINACTPMFLFISGSVNNDNLVIPLCALALLIMIRLCRRQNQKPGFSPGWVALGVVIGLAILSKISGLALLPLAALSGAWAAWQRRSWRHLFAAGLAIGLPVLLLSGWWFWRNVQLYGDLLGYSLFTPYFTRAVPADLAQIWSERTSFLYGYWGNFGGLNLPIPKWAYMLLNGVAILAIAGIAREAVSGFRSLVSGSPALSQGDSASVRLQVASELHVSRFFPLFLITAWGLVVFVSWLNWTTSTWSSQGRLVFSAIFTYSIWMAAGLAGLLPRRAAPYLIGAIGGGMTLLSASLPFGLIAPAYARPAQLTPAQLASIQQPVNVTFGSSLALLGYDAPATSVQAGGSISITLYWQTLSKPDRDYSVFVHLLDEHELEVQAKGPAYPGRGNLLATTLQPGQSWAETWVVPVHSTAYTPARLRWEIGLYDAGSGQRLAAVDESGQSLGDHIRFGQVALERAAGGSFNPVSYNFGDQLELTGFDLDRRTAAPGDTITLQLAWRALGRPERDYTVFVHVLQLPQTKWAGVDQQPTPPTSIWQPGQVVSESYPLVIDAATPPGVYDIELGVYYFSTGASIERLKVLTRDGRQQQDYILLSKVRVAGSQ